MARLSQPGKGEMIDIYVLGPACEFADSEVPSFGKSAGCGPFEGQDFAICTWPIVVKVVCHRGPRAAPAIGMLPV